jgi:serine/threonine-protein kinase
LVDLVGQGGSGVVYLGRDLSLGRKVAVKLLHEGLSADTAFIRRFHAEAKAAASLNHPNIVKVFDWGEAEGSPYLVFEFLAGGTLRNFLDSGQRLSISQAAKISGDVAGALAYAHARGYIHRDIKPSNLLFDEEGRIRIADFGIARALSEAAWTEPVGTVLGTARYASPEQAMGNAANQAADIYSFALVMLEAVTGELPFVADTTLGTLIARTKDDLSVPEQLGELAPLIRMMGKVDPAERWTAAKIAEEAGLIQRALPVPELLKVEKFSPSAAATDPPTQVARLEPVDAEAPVAAGRIQELVVAPSLYDQDDGLNGHVAQGPSTNATARMDSLPASEPAGATQEPGKAKGKGILAGPWRKLGLALLVAILLAASGYFAAWRLESAAVPNVVSRTQAVAVSMIKKAGFSQGSITWTHSHTVPEGEVVSQSPTARLSLWKGTKISLVISLGPPDVRVPSVVGETKAAAQAALSAEHLTYTETAEYSETVNAGDVISQAMAGEIVQPGTAVAMVISEGPAPRTVPNLVGATQAAASAQLAAIQLGVTVVQAYSNTVNSGVVMSRSVAPGNKVARGTVITITVSQGPHLVTVPNLLGATLSQAEATLKQIGLTLVLYSGSNPSGASQVTGQLPVPGKVVLYGSQVIVATQ